MDDSSEGNNEENTRSEVMEALKAVSELFDGFSVSAKSMADYLERLESKIKNEEESGVVAER